MDVEHARPAKRRHLAAEERQRAIRACVECRRLKEKCEGGMPCRRCHHLRRPCEFNRQPATTDKRAPDSAGSVKDLMDRLRCMGFILKHHFPDLALDIESLRRTCDTLSTQNDRSEPAAELLDLSINAQPSESSGIEDENCTIDSVDDTTVHYSGEFSHWNFSMHIKRNIDDLMARSNVPSIDNANQVPDFIRVGVADPGSTSISDIVAILPPRSVATFLINVFFKHSTSFYYYIDRGWLDGILDRIYTNVAGLRSKDVTPSCLVLMVLAVGTQYVHLESPDKNSRRISSVSSSSEAPNSWELDIGTSFYRQVAKLLSEVIHSGSLLSVQVFLLLGLYCLPIDASGLSYIYLNLAVKVAIQNGMHRKVSRSAIDAKNKEFRRRIWWTAYCMERKIGVYHGRPASINRSDIDADIPQSVEGGNISNDSFDTSGLLESIDLTRHAEAFLQEISRLRTCERSEVGTILSRIKLMKTNLRGSWVPPCRDGQSPSTVNREERSLSRAEIHSRLECCLLHMFIGRPFILAHRQRRPNDISPQASEASRTKTAESHMQWDFLVQDCVAAAREVISVCHDLQTGGLGLAKSSYTEYSSCRASLLVLIAYSVCYRTNEFASTLQRGLDAIREMASVGDSARSEVHLLETLESALHRLHVFDPTTTGPKVAAAEDLVEEGGYEGFVNWYSRLGGLSRSRTAQWTQHGGVEQRARPQTRELGLHAGPSIHDPAVTGMSDDTSMDMYPFDFDLLHTDGNAAFFTPEFNQHGNPERELFENLFWMPK
ncbi:fungal-specific transcription factor domain-containing protein [Boeremia exigua]|uniref:fungal-specific transcription factor domain-containing protein n=1 Tax=Boeremia exigua TaxID=749465 RepID=UPI001E8E9F45|nr:fungal-specific transcription factor domain-containing protein [Boeremia exigua]KAH6639895.1 fungal-specific transcription factor domain-containing protein [Boeremia exigua]